MAQISGQYKVVVCQLGSYHFQAQVYNLVHEIVYKTKVKIVEGQDSYKKLIERVNKKLETNFKSE